MFDVSQPWSVHWRGWLLAAVLAGMVHLPLLWLLAGSNQGPALPAPHTLHISMERLIQAKQEAAAPVKTGKRQEVRQRSVARPQPAKPVRKKIVADAASRPEPSTDTASDAAPPDEPAAEESPVARPSIPDRSPDYRATYLNNPVPQYPNAARRRGLQGRVLLHVEVLASGYCGHIDIQRSSGHGLLDEAAVEAVKQWRFVPAQHMGMAVTRWMMVPIRFQLVAGRQR